MRIYLSLLSMLILRSGVLCAEEAATQQPWNVVLILADDLGWTDLGCYGSDFYETPRLDRLAAQGMRFTQNYSACTVCSPTRAALLTGKYPARLHITDWIPGQVPDNPKLLPPQWTKELPLEEVTLAEVFRQAGYATASIGKWHLGPEPYYPEHQGFELNIAGTEKAAPPSFLAPWRIPNLPEGAPGDYLTDRLGELAAEWIHGVHDRPFFLYLPHFAVHTPIQGPPELVNKYKSQRSTDRTHRNPQYAGMLESLDSAVGCVLDKIEELGLTHRTIVIFTSDNGGRITQQTTSNIPLKFGKASAYEGGVRVPLIIRWPGKTAANSTCHVPVITMDLFPTLLEACQLPASGNQLSQQVSTTGAPGRDGVSLIPLLLQTGGINREELYWHYPHHQHYQQGGAMPYSAIRCGDYKLIEFLDSGHSELYKVADDIGERTDLAAVEPEVARRLREKLHHWRTQVGAQLPLPNPDYNPALPQYNSQKPQPRAGELPAAAGR